MPKFETEIILPNYNSSNFLNQTLKSVINQSYKNWRLTIVDDASNIATKKILKKFKNFKKINIIWLKRNRGAAYCRNLAIKKSNSRFLAFLDSDDVWNRNKLKYQINFMKKNKYDFTYTYYETFGEKNLRIIPPVKFDLSNFLKNTSIATSTMIINRKKVKNFKFSDTEICEDYFYKCSILKKLKYAHCLKKFLTKYRIRRSSLQSNKFKNIYWIWKINKRFNKLNFFNNFISIFHISLNSFKKYGLK